MEKLVKIDLGKKSKHSIAMAKVIGEYEEDKNCVVVKVTKMLKFNLHPMLMPMFTDFQQIIEKRQIIG